MGQGDQGREVGHISELKAMIDDGQGGAGKNRGKGETRRQEMGPCDWLDGGWLMGRFYPIHQPRVRPLLETGLAFLSLLLLCPHQPAHLSAQSHSTLKAQVSPPPRGILIVPSPVLIIRVFCVSSLPSNSNSHPPLCCANQETSQEAPSQHQVTFRS